MNNTNYGHTEPAKQQQTTREQQTARRRQLRQQRAEWNTRARSQDPAQRGAGWMWSPLSPPDPHVTEQWFDTVMVNRWPSVNVVARGHAKVARWIEEPGELARRLKGKMPEWGGPSVWGTPGTAEDKPGDHAIGLFWYHTDAKPNAALKAFLNLAAFYGASVVELRVACSGVGSWKGRIERVFMFDVILAPASRGRTRSRVRRWVLSLVPDRDRSPSLIEAQIPDFVPFIMPNGRPTANWPTSNMIPMEQGKAPEVPMRARGRRRDARGQVGEQGGAL